LKETRIFIILTSVFLAASFIPFSRPAVQNGVNEGLLMVQEYAREHVLLCLIPAFFIAGAISVFVRKDSIIRLMGPKSNKVVAYGIASVSGSVLAVCSCTVLPLFAGIYTRGAGIGPASAFLYSGPAINVLAVIVTARVLGAKIGLARALGAVVFAVLIGLLMHIFFGRSEGKDRNEIDAAATEEEKDQRPLWKTALSMAVMIGILVIINWSPGGSGAGFFYAVYKVKWIAGGALLAVLAWMIVRWFRKDELEEWVLSTWIFAKQIFPLLLGGVFVAGFLLGRPGHEGLVPGAWVEGLVGGDGLAATLFASVAGAFMYFATLTEVPILQGLLGSGMGQGPALALLLAGPALSLPSMLVIRRIFGTAKALAYFLLVIAMAAVTGLIFGGVF